MSIDGIVSTGDLRALAVMFPRGELVEVGCGAVQYVEDMALRI